MEWWLAGKGRGEVILLKPLLVRAGAAIAVSFAGYFLFHLRPRFCKNRRRRRLPRSGDREVWRSTGGLKEELRPIEIEEVSQKAEGCIATSAVVLFSPMTRSSGHEEKHLLPQFNQLLLKEIELPATEIETISTTTTSNPKKWNPQEMQIMEQEIASLKSKVNSLQDRERKLELQLLEYYGLKEQETSMRELENRLKINAVEAKLFSSTIESLQTENRRLEAQVSDYSIVTTELEVAKDKVKLLNWKLRSGRENAKEKLAALQQRLVELQESGCKYKEYDEEIEHNIVRLKDLEDENIDLRNKNSQLAQQNLDLNKELESSRMQETDSCRNSEVNEALEEANFLQQRNEELKKEIEQLQMDRCADAEEMVYLKWVNACLRYELRNYRPPAGKTIARDLSKTLSPKSEEKAKQLIFEYAHSKEDANMLTDFDHDCCTFSQTMSLLGDSSSIKNESHSNKTKFFSKLKKLVLRKDFRGGNRSSFSSERDSTSCGSLERHRRTVYSYSSDDLVGLGSEYSGSIASNGNMDCTTPNHSKSELLHKKNKAWWKRSSSRSSFTSPKMNIPSPEGKSDSSYTSRGFGIGEGSSISSSHSTQLDVESMDSPEKAELKKFANALSTSKLPYHQRSDSFEPY